MYRTEANINFQHCDMANSVGIFLETNSTKYILIRDATILNDNGKL
jgi:hypothetical protein